MQWEVNVKNNNQKVIRHLSNKSLKNNKMRNIFAITAIALTALLFTALFSLSMGMIQLTEEQSMRQIGTWAHAGLKDVTVEEYEKLTSHPLVKDSSYDIIIGIAQNEQLIKRQTEIRYTEPKNLKFGFMELKKGKLPEKENEIVVDTIVMDMLGVPHEIGAEVSLKFNFMGKDYDETFTVSGWYEGDSVIGASQVYLSKAFLNQIMKNYTESDLVTAKKTNSLGVGLIQADIIFKNSKHIEENLIQVIEESGYTKKEIDYGINWGYLSERSQDIDGTTLIIIIVVFIVMLLTGYLIIYNIFQISIISDIRFYGLLKTIGATKKQIQRLVKRQAVILSCIGIPIGLILGYLVGNLMLPLFLQEADGLNSTNFHVKPNPYIFLFGTLFSLITVFISCRKPGKIAGSVSPIEATKYADSKEVKKKSKKTKNGARLNKMALSNMARNKKKTMVVVLSMSLSVILLTEVVTLTKSFSIDQYLESMLTGDFMISSASLTNYSSTADLTLAEDFYNAVNSQEGIESSSRLYHNKGYLNHTLSESGQKQFQEFYDNDLLDIRDGAGSNIIDVQNTLIKNAPIAEQRFAYDDPLLKKLKVLEGKIDFEKFNTGNYILVGTMTESKDACYSPGDMVELQFKGPDSELVKIKDEDGNITDLQWVNNTKKTYEVMAVVDIPIGMTEHRFEMNGLTTILPVEELLENDNDAECFADSLLIEDDKEVAFQSFLENYTTQVDPNTDFESKEGLRDEFESMIKTIGLVGGALSMVIAIIGILNFINTMLTSVITRKREFAMMQSIGLTNDQLKRMLLYEGLYYVCFTALISFIIGSILSVSVIRAFNNIASFFEYHFTIVPFVGVLPVFLVLAFIVPSIAYHNTKKQSIVERLRNAE